SFIPASFQWPNISWRSLVSRKRRDQPLFPVSCVRSNGFSTPDARLARNGGFGLPPRKWRGKNRDLLFLRAAAEGYRAGVATALPANLRELSDLSSSRRGGAKGTRPWRGAARSALRVDREIFVPGVFIATK